MIKCTTDFHLNIKIDNKPIKQIQECKSLGVIIDQYLPWNSNTENISKKATARIRGGSRGRQISRATEVKIAYLKKFDSSYLLWPVDRVTKICNRASSPVIRFTLRQIFGKVILVSHEQRS